MAGDNESVEFKLDLDTREFLEKLLHAKESVGRLGESENFAGLLEGLSKASLAIGVVGTAALALKTAFETVFEAEQIKQINDQFETLSKNAGIAGDVLSEGLKKAARGLVDDTDLLKAANRSIIEMGDSAKKLPEILDLARKATQVMGGNLVTNFEAINQAIATGSTRHLKQLGIIVDSDKAMREYAKSIGVSVDALSQAGKQQALMNAVLETGGARFSGIGEDVKKATNTWTEFKVVIDQVKETMILAFDKVAGPAVRGWLAGLKEAATDAKRFIDDKFGTGTEQAVAHTSRLQEKLRDLKGELLDLEYKKGGALDFAPGDTIARIHSLNLHIKTTQEELGKAAEKAKELKAATDSVGGGVSSGGRSSVDDEKQKEQKAKFQQDLLQITQQRIAAEEALGQTSLTAEMARNAQLLQVHQEMEAKIAAIEAQKANGHISTVQAQQLEDETRATSAAKSAALEDKFLSKKQEMAKQQTAIATDIASFESKIAEQRFALMERLNKQIQATQASTQLDAKQKAAQIQELEQTKHDKLVALEKDLEQQRIQALEAYARKTKDVASGIEAGMAAASLKAQVQMKDMGRVGEGASNLIANNFSYAFQKIGEATTMTAEGQKKAFGDILSHVLGSIGTQAVAEGTLRILAGIYPPNPVSLSSGAALVAFGGALGGISAGISAPSGSISTSAIKDGSQSAVSGSSSIGSYSSQSNDFNSDVSARDDQYDTMRAKADQEERKRQREDDKDKARQKRDEERADKAADKESAKQERENDRARREEERRQEHEDRMAMLIAEKEARAAAHAPDAREFQQQKKSVNIQVMGHFFETEQTKTHLVDLIRQATDATDFTIKQIGER